MASPARAPKTMESATPLPPRRLAPWTPPESSPATNTPGRVQRAPSSICTRAPGRGGGAGGQPHNGGPGEGEAVFGAAFAHAAQFLHHALGAEVQRVHQD